MKDYRLQTTNGNRTTRADIAEEALRGFLTKIEESNRELRSHYGSYSSEPVEVSAQKLMQKELTEAAERIKRTTRGGNLV